MKNHLKILHSVSQYSGNDKHLKIKNKKFKYMTTLEKAKLSYQILLMQKPELKVQNWIDTNSPELEDSFYRELELNKWNERIMGA